MWQKLLVALLLSMTGMAWAGDPPDRAMQIYDQVQGMRDMAGKLVDPARPDPRHLQEAGSTLRQALGVLNTTEVKRLGNGNVYLASRRSNVNRDLAEVLALEGHKKEALDALDAILADAWFGDLITYYESDPALTSLHDEPRFQAFLATLRANNRLWSDTAFTTPVGNMPDEAHRIAGLSLFWSQAKYNFVYFDHVPGLNWDQTYLDFLPRVIAAKNLHDYYDVLMRLAPLLHDGHTNVYPPASIQDEFYANPPLSTALVEGHVLVVAVNSPHVAVTGVHAGDEIVSIDGMEAYRYAEERVAPYVSSGTTQDRAVRMYTYQLLHGDHRQSVTLGLRDASGWMHTATLSREQDPAARPRSMFQWRLLKGGIAYLSLDEFADDRAAKAFEQAWPKIRQASGLILDVRRNGGGSSRPGQIILSYLSSQPIPSGHATTRVYSPAAHANGETWMAWQPLPDSDEPFEQARAEHFNGPVALLIGARTFSAGEDFTMMFDAMKRGVLVGETTGGGTGNPLQFELPGGGKARICAKRDVYPDGREFVGKGIAPDIVVTTTVADIRAGRDPVLERAVAVLRMPPSAGMSMLPSKL